MAIKKKAKKVAVKKARAPKKFTWSSFVKDFIADFKKGV
jgi:hypothetical protein